MASRINEIPKICLKLTALDGSELWRSTRTRLCKVPNQTFNRLRFLGVIVLLVYDGTIDKTSSEDTCFSSLWKTIIGFSP